MELAKKIYNYIRDSRENDLINYGDILQKFDVRYSAKNIMLNIRFLISRGFVTTSTHQSTMLSKFVILKNFKQGE